MNSGSTAVVVLIRDGQMWSANAGDSRAILATTGDTDTTTSQLQLVALTTDHNPDLPTEKVMIITIVLDVVQYSIVCTTVVMATVLKPAVAVLLARLLNELSNVKPKG
jgi:Protein phosphatase 2C